MTDGDPGARETTGAPVQRKRLVLKKRDPVEAARLEAERVANLKNSPFGNARPREQVIAQRTGKDEQAILREEASKYAVKLRLSPAQFAQKRDRVEEIEQLKAELPHVNPNDVHALKADIADKEKALEELLAGFEELAIAKAKAGDQQTRVPDRRREVRSDSEGTLSSTSRSSFGRSGELELHSSQTHPQAGHSYTVAPPPGIGSPAGRDWGPVHRDPLGPHGPAKAFVQMQAGERHHGHSFGYEYGGDRGSFDRVHVSSYPAAPAHKGHGMYRPPPFPLASDDNDYVPFAAR